MHQCSAIGDAAVNAWPIRRPTRAPFGDETADRAIMERLGRVPGAAACTGRPVQQLGVGEAVRCTGPGPVRRRKRRCQ